MRRRSFLRPRLRLIHLRLFLPTIILRSIPLPGMCGTGMVLHGATRSPSAPHPRRLPRQVHSPPCQPTPPAARTLSTRPSALFSTSGNGITISCSPRNNSGPWCRTLNTLWSDGLLYPVVGVSIQMTTNSTSPVSIVLGFAPGNVASSSNGFSVENLVAILGVVGLCLYLFAVIWLRFLNRRKELAIVQNAASPPGTLASAGATPNSLGSTLDAASAPTNVPFR